MARVRHGDLILELVEVCRELRTDLQSRLAYYRASAYKHESVKQLNIRIDQLRAIFQILADADLDDAMADHDAVMEGYGNGLFAGDCSVTTRIGLLLDGMEPALISLTRRFSHSQSAVRPETVRVILRHKQTLMHVCREGSRSLEILRGL
jgi:hypothetical protein